MMLLPVGLLLLITATYVLLRWVAGRLRVPRESCPGCGHPVHGLVDPRCPECGGDLVAGVVGAGRSRPRRGLWLGVVTLVLAVIVPAVSLGVFNASWTAIMHWAGLIQRAVDLDRVVTVGIDQSNRMSVASTASFVTRNGSNATGEVEVTLRSDEQELAAWAGTGPVVGPNSSDVIVDGMEAVEALRLQIPPNSDSRFAPILHDPDDALILARTITNYAGPNGGVSSSVEDSRGRSMFNGGISATSNNRMGLVWPSAIWFAPAYVISGVIFLAYLWLGVRILRERGRLQPFKPHVDEV